MTPVHVPEIATSGTIITVSCLFVRPGDEVVAGDRVIELLLGEMTFDVASPATGRIVALRVEMDEPVAVGQVLAQIEEDAPLCS